MKVFRILFSDDITNDAWICDPNITNKDFNPDNVKRHHYPGFDEITAITTAKLFLFDSGYSKKTLNYIIQSFEDQAGYWENIFECKIEHEECSKGTWN